MDPCLLDSNVLEYLFNKDENVIKKANQHIALYDQLYISIISYYEVVRGHKHLESLSPRLKRVARKKQKRFDQFCYENQIFELNQYACRKAAEIYAHLKKNNIQVEDDGDILIAGIALANGLTIVTHNLKDFEKIPGLTVEDWT